MEVNDKVAKGKVVSHGSNGFIYEYICENPDCLKKFYQVQTPEVSRPALCHRCYTGNDLQIEKKRHRYHSNKRKKKKGGNNVEQGGRDQEGTEGGQEA